MSDVDLKDWLTRKQAAIAFDRAVRTLTRDFRNASIANDTELLSLCLLSTNDGATRLGSDVHLGDVSKLKQQGLEPEWHYHPDYIKVLQRRSKPTRTPDQFERPLRTVTQEIADQPIPSLELLNERLTSTNSLLSRVEKELENLKQDKHKLQHTIERQQGTIEELVKNTGTNTKVNSMMMASMLPREKLLELQAAHPDNQAIQSIVQETKDIEGKKGFWTKPRSLRNLFRRKS